MVDLQMGPPIHRLHERLLAYPESPAPRGQDLLALVYDLAHRVDPGVTAEVLEPLVRLPQCQLEPDEPETSAHPDVFMLMIWLLADEAFSEPTLSAIDLVSLLLSADNLMATRYPNLQDEDQREELIRLALNGLRLKPRDETDHQARDRLLMVSSSERARVVAASRAAEERAEAIRQALAEQRAREAADKYTRE